MSSPRRTTIAASSSSPSFNFQLDHALNHIRRWLLGLVIMMADWDIQLILQVGFFCLMYKICHLIYDFRFVESSSLAKAGTSSDSIPIQGRHYHHSLDPQCCHLTHFIIIVFSRRWKSQFDSLNGASLEFVRQHLESFGGRVNIYNLNDGIECGCLNTLLS